VTPEDAAIETVSQHPQANCLLPRYARILKSRFAATYERKLVDGRMFFDANQQLIDALRQR